MTSKAKKLLPLSAILQDLALLRASGHDLKGTLQTSDATPSSPTITDSVAASYDYVATIRAALKLKDSGKLEGEGKKIEDVRNKYEGLIECLEDSNS